eukprot:TRINITY_DN196_c0_g1_i1.p1 TRINITY_DN196_c0_g1~~TRINITY_DN196_c0_g1_i1.p1  ORF type:complete len:306 (+),score=44.38 TRINITY_DN196_c0_g1_i1:50-919(+)
MASFAQLALLVSSLLLGALLGSFGTYWTLQPPGPSERGARLLSALRLNEDTYPAAKLEPAPKVCAVAGVGPGIGESVARRFAAGGCRVALLARHVDALENLSASIPGSKAYACDVTVAEQVVNVFSAIRADLGDVDALIYNVGGGKFLGYDNITEDTLDIAFKTNALGLLLTAQQVGPGMTKRGHGVIGITGATSSWRGLSYTAGFAPGKFAERGLAESLARDLGPKGVHVFHAVIDGAVAGSRPEPSNKSLRPEDIAETYYNLALQPRSAWTFEVSLFPWADTTWYSI